MSGDLITLTRQGLYCEAGGFHIDPMGKVDLALVTHAHSDHARRGSRRYVCAAPGRGLLELRVGGKAPIEGVRYGETLRFGGAKVSFHPAGHILGSAQVRVEAGGEVWVVSGDYKRDADPSCDPFEVQRCDTFVTEATFGHPSYRWGDTTEVAREIWDWWEEARAEGRNCLLFCYALGKTQRVLAELAAFTERRVLLYGEAAPMTECYRREGVRLVPTERLEDVARDGAPLSGELVLAPHSIASTEWMRRLGDPETAFASGWMRTGAHGVRRRYDRGFVMSDHADWPALLRTVQETGARQVGVLHGGEGPLTRQLRSLGIDAWAMEPGVPRERSRIPVQGELF